MSVSKTGLMKPHLNIEIDEIENGWVVTIYQQPRLGRKQFYYQDPGELAEAVKKVLISYEESRDEQA